MMRALRMAGFVLVVAGIASWMLVSRAAARLDRQMLETGPALAAALPAPRDGRAAGAMLVNGQRVFAASVRSPHRLEEVIDHAAEHCRDAGWIPAAGLEAVSLGTSSRERPGWRSGVLAEIEGDHGYVACLGTSEAAPPLRYLYAHRTSPTSTTIAAVWTDRSFSLDALLPRSEGDAPGLDLAGVPRPRRSRRILSVAREGDAMTIHRSAPDLPLASVERALRRDLAATGWRCGATVPTSGGGRVIPATAGARRIELVLSAGDGEVTTVSFETRGPDAP